MSLLVVGTLALDSVETPFTRRHDQLGGSAAFCAVAASYLAPVRVVGVVGADFPADHLAFLRARGIDTEGVELAPGRSFRWHGRYEYDLNVRHTVETQLNVLSAFMPRLPPSYLDTKIVALGNFDPALQLAVLDQLKAPQLIACDTMNFWIERERDALLRTLTRVHILSVNDSEARQLSGEYSLIKAARAIHQMGPRSVVIKRGEHGAMVFAPEGIFTVPAYPLELVRDPTGAGDAFAGGMMGFLTRRTEHPAAALRQSAVMGSVMASFAVEDFSIDRLRALTRDEIRLRFSEFKALTHFEADGALIWE